MGLEDAIGVSYVNPIRDERGWSVQRRGLRRPRSTAFEFLSEAYTASEPGYEGRASVPGAVGHASGARSSTTSRPTSCGCWAPSSRRWPPTPSSCIPSGCAATSTRSAQVIYDGVNNAVYKTGFSTQPAGLRARGRQPVPDPRPARPAARRPALPVRPRAGRDRLAAVHHAGPLRRRLPDPLQVLDPQAGRVREPVALRPRPVPVAGRRRDGQLRRDPRPLLPHAPDDQPLGDRGGSARRRASPRPRARAPGLTPVRGLPSLIRHMAVVATEASSLVTAHRLPTSAAGDRHYHGHTWA